LKPLAASLRLEIQLRMSPGCIKKRALVPCAITRINNNYCAPFAASKGKSKCSVVVFFRHVRNQPFFDVSSVLCPT
jgi:hypothetical protein